MSASPAQKQAWLNPRRVSWIVLTSACIALAFYFHLPARAQDILRTTLNWIGGLGIWGPILFALLYIVACLLLIHPNEPNL